MDGSIHPGNCRAGAPKWALIDSSTGHAWRTAVAVQSIILDARTLTRVIENLLLTHLSPPDFQLGLPHPSLILNPVGPQSIVR